MSATSDGAALCYGNFAPMNSRVEQARQYVAAAALVSLVSLIAVALRTMFPVPDLALLYLLAVMVVAVRYPRGPAFAASAMSVVAYDYVLVPPYFTLAVADARYWLTFAMMFGFGLIVSELATRNRRSQAVAAKLADEARDAKLRVHSEEIRSSLLSAVSHDLRTPLATITGAATTLRDQPQLDIATRDELLAAVCDEAERLERLVGDLLDMTRVDAGGLHVRRELVPMDEMIGSAFGRLERKLAPRVVHVAAPPQLALVAVDPVLFEQVFINLIENAIKYTPVTATVTVTITSTAQLVVVEFADDGPGFAAGAEAHVFEKFFRGQHQGIGGVGLGLAICRGIVEAHGGTITARNRATGGALFTLQMPRAHLPEMAVQP